MPATRVKDDRFREDQSFGIGTICGPLYFHPLFVYHTMFVCYPKFFCHPDEGGIFF